MTTKNERTISLLQVSGLVYRMIRVKTVRERRELARWITRHLINYLDVSLLSKLDQDVLEKIEVNKAHDIWDAAHEDYTEKRINNKKAPSAYKKKGKK